MGYLNKATITVDAILTNRGRELLADKVAGNFDIKKFAVADDEIDYRLYRTDHPQGSARYGAIIENMPMLEATPDETQTMRYKLVTYTGATANLVIPQITGLNYPTGLTLYNTPSNTAGTSQAREAQLKPQTTYTMGSAGTETNYVVVVADGSLVEVKITNPSSPVPVPNARGSITAVGKEFSLIANKAKTGKTTVTVYGQDTGATYNFSLTVN